MVEHETYLGWWADVVTFDANNTDAEIRDREARRLISVNQEVADKWLSITPDTTVKHSCPRSALTRTAVERRLGVYVSVGQAIYDAKEAAGETVTQSDRLGDTVANSESATARHNKFNRACRDAIAARAVTTVILGDKGDGSPRARAAAKQRFAWANDGHVTDIIHKHAANNGNHVCYESKVYTPIKKTVNLGGGTRRDGGSPSTAAGNLVAFGCTEERLLYEIEGARERGRQADGPFDHGTGTGWVKAHDGYYRDAIYVKKNTVVPLIAETFGGVTPTVVATLRRLDKTTNAAGTDGTAYGVYSTHGFFAHHAAAISIAIVTGEAEAIVQGVSKLETRMTGQADAHRG